MRKFLSVLALTSVLLGAGCAQTISRPATQQALDTSSWKTYTNTLCGLSLKYPSDAVFASQTDSDAVITTQDDIDFQNGQDGEAPSSYYVGVSCKDIANLDEFFAKNTSSTIQKIGTTLVGGQSAITALIGADHHYSLWVQHDRVSMIDFSYADSASALTPIQSAILESITFTR